MASMEPAPGPAPARPLYFVSAVVDYACIGALSLATWALLGAFHSGERTHAVTSLSATLLWFCNWPHFSATSYRLYHCDANIRQYPMTALAVPWVVLAGVAGSLAWPQIVAPYFVKLFTIWSPYHFSGQTVGITLIYARRAGFSVGPLTRLALSGFVYGTFLTATLRAEVGVGGSTYYGVAYPGFGVPAWMPRLAFGWTVACGVALLLAALRFSVERRRLLPPIVLLPAAAQCVWFLTGAGLASFVEFVPFFHSLQYMLIAWALHLKERKDRDAIPGSLEFVATESARWGTLNVLGGACLFFLFPRMVALAGWPLEFSTGIAIAGVQIHHFFVDGVIWKLRSPAVSSPLMVNVSELAGEPA